MQKEIAILFSTPMVQALSAGRKTVTRRVVKPQPDEKATEFFPSTHKGKDWMARFQYEGSNPARYEATNIYKCRYGKPGDILWVRESWQEIYFEDDSGDVDFNNPTIRYAADSPEPIPERDGDGFQIWKKDGSEKFIGWKPSIHMKKEHARIWLQVESVRVERVQDISEEDAEAEGAEAAYHRCGGFGYYEGGGEVHDCTCQNWEFDEHKMGFKSLWQSINGEESWNSNPWVWVISFKVLSTTGKPL